MRMRGAVLVLAVPLLTAPLLIACGPTLTGAASSPSPSPSAELARYREVIDCIRQNGAPNFPDPIVKADGKIGVPDGVEIPAQAESACEHLAEGLSQHGDKPQHTAAELTQLRKLAQCFRDNGVPDWPDPGPDGAFPVPDRLMTLGKAAIRDQLPKCRQYLVGKGIEMVPESGAGG